MEAEHRDQGRTVAFRVPSDVWAKVSTLMRQRKARASVILRELVATGLAAQREGQGQPTTGGRQEHES